VVAETPFGSYEIDWMPVIYDLDKGLLMPVQADAEAQVIDRVLRIAGVS
jgi:hypothetical protein